MPLTRITLMKGRSAAELRMIADAVQEALIEAFAVPAEDRFQIIEQREPGEIVYSPTYLDIERTDRLVIVHIVAGNWRDDAAKRALYRAITDGLLAKAGMRGEDVQVILSSNERADWSFGNGVASYLPPPADS